MTDILFLLMALALVALVMVPVVAEGIRHTEFKKREPFIRATLALNELARTMQAFSSVVLRMTVSFEEFARVLRYADAAQKRGR